MTKNPSYENIVINFNKWMKENHNRMLTLTLYLALIEIEDKWKELITEYVDYLLSHYEEISKGLKN